MKKKNLFCNFKKPTENVGKHSTFSVNEAESVLDNVINL